MARKPRIHFPGAFYHVILRGNGGQDIFHSNQDRLHLYQLIQEGVDRFACRIHAFCFMTNHIHLVVQVGDIPLAKIIQNLSFRYTRYINKQNERVGHLFQGRYKALLVDTDGYLLELIRYIHGNPIRAGLVQDPGLYQWSSHQAYLGGKPIQWLTTDFVLSQFAGSKSAARKLLAEFCSKALDEKPAQELHAGTFEGRVLGSDRFCEHALARAEGAIRSPIGVEELIKAVCRAYELDRQTLIAPGKKQPAAQARAVAAFIARDEAGAPSLTELGRYFRRDITALSRAGQRLFARLGSDEELSGKVSAIRRELRRKS